MTDKEILFVASLSISLPFLGGIYALRNLDIQKVPIWPLVVCSGIGFGNEIYCYKTTDAWKFNLVANTYLLVEFILMLVQLKLWNSSMQRKEVYLFSATAIVVWMVTTIIVGGPGYRNVPFTLIYYFILILLFIRGINGQLFNRGGFKKTFIVVSVAMAGFYTYGMIVEVFVMNYELFSYQFVLSIFYIKVVFNVIVNIIISYSLLCIPKKQEYLLSF